MHLKKKRNTVEKDFPIERIIKVEELTSWFAILQDLPISFFKHCVISRLPNITIPANSACGTGADVLPLSDVTIMGLFESEMV